MFKSFSIKNIAVAPDTFTIIAGPCVIESEESCFGFAQTLVSFAQKQGVQLIFKASYDKANRTSLQSYRGPGIKEGLRILRRIKEELHVPVLSDVHTPQEAEEAGEVLDCLQIPAFLCRQTDLLVAAAQTGKAVNIKKGQFVSPNDMRQAIDKVRKTNENVLVTERGFAFGYNNLVVDMRSLAILSKLDVPVIFDATHSVQLPGGGEQSGGAREFIPVLARAAAGAGVNGMFIETHPEPEHALSDSACMLPFDQFGPLVQKVLAIHDVVGSTRDE